MYSQTSNYPSESRRIDLDPKVKDRFGQPAMRMTHDWREEDKRSVEFRLTIKRRIARALLIRGEEPLAPLYHLSTHEVGVTRMGEDPKTSVLTYTASRTNATARASSAVANFRPIWAIIQLEPSRRWPT
jgi:gluconate 2-dehydrogenase alpha chain